ncbi:hypothetical protein H310_00249 [Aphanomyces invadans]|uniref:Uncharacterized protein n=1 Tax=Aphanomyces invadans TaxID=157072 RepID=A0A024UTS8_9STRA|nr:hypothetical protein H310_00249 [Aphanomyces invadans]ETW09764.1 hypothetical protein H310_00249 [Aphanomyces invadans]|eukprot:XP_008861175.1 hypothetical protein H310_00249 [Aphanomyces invadans]
MPSDAHVRRCFRYLSKEFEADDVYAEFQQVDVDGKGHLKRRVFVQTLTTLVGDASNIDVDSVAETFERSKKEVNYTQFCHELQEYKEEHAKSKGESSKTNDKHNPPRKSYSIDAATEDECSDDSSRRGRSRKQHGNAKHGNDSDDLTKRTVRIDHRLETHRVFKASIRHKILHGVKRTAASAAKHGFDSIRDLLLRQDRTGEGTLDEQVFVGTLLDNMKAPLTQKEMAYLTVNLRNKRQPSCINYEQIGHFLCVDSEEEASTSGDDDISPPPRRASSSNSPSKKQLDQPHLGSDVLNLERDLKLFMTQRVPKTIDGVTRVACCHVPKSIFTGAEKFVEACELYDPLETGGLAEDGYEKVLAFCGLTVTRAQLRSVLSKFPRTSQGLVSYAAFLERYGQHLATVRNHKHMKTILQRLAMDPNRDAMAHLTQFRQQMEKIDARVTGVPTGIISKKDFIACVTSHNSLRWPKQDTEALLPLFIDPSKATKHKDVRVVHYPEFLRMLKDSSSDSMPDQIPCHCTDNLSNASKMDRLHDKLYEFLHDQSRGVGTRGRDIAEHAFESADKLRHGTSATVSGYLTERDFFTVLRTIGAGISPAEQQLLLHALSQAGYITSQGIAYLCFLRHFDVPVQRTKSPRHHPNSVDVGSMCVGTYLADHATAQERENFEAILATFRKMQLEPVESSVTSSQLVYHLGPVLKASLQFFT